MSGRRLHRAAALMAIGAISVSSLMASTNDGSSSSVTSIAHRGGIIPGVPENTMAAFRQAIKHGSDVIEIDLRGTKDGEIVIIHDQTLERTTNGKGRVDQHSLAELKTLDAGQGERIPTYDEALQLVADTNVKLLLDVKESPTLNKRRVVQLTDQYHAWSTVIVGVSSLDDYRAFRELGTKSRTLAFIKGVEDIDPFIRAGADIIRLWPKWIYEKPELVAQVHRSGRTVWTTADDAPREELIRLINLGVNGILSDSPELMRTVLAEMKKASRR